MTNTPLALAHSTPQPCLKIKQAFHPFSQSTVSWCHAATSASCSCNCFDFTGDMIDSIEAATVARVRRLHVTATN